MKFFEDIRIGDRAEIGSYAFTADAIKAFAARYDPQPVHLDEAAAAQSPFGRLRASGWHVACMWMRLRIAYREREDAAQRTRGELVAQLGPSPGFRDLQWLRPVYPDDTISYATEVMDKRVSISRPGWGIITTRNTGANQQGEPVLSFISSAFIERRPKRAM